MLRVNDDVSIDESELDFAYARSSGPGGQNVNKVETKVVLLFNVEQSAGLSDEQKQLIHDRLGGRISKTGVLRVACQKYRTRGANQRAAVGIFLDLIAKALTVDPVRTKTRIPKKSRRRRLENKRRRSEKKRLRSRPDLD